MSSRKYKLLQTLLTEAGDPDKIVGPVLERVKKWVRASVSDLGKAAPKVKRSAPSDWKRMMRMKRDLEQIANTIDVMLDEF